jgi:hypothetical protein
MLDVLVNRFGNLSPGSGGAVRAGGGGGEGEEGEDVNGTWSGVSGKSIPNVLTYYSVKRDLLWCQKRPTIELGAAFQERAEDKTRRTDRRH